MTMSGNRVIGETTQTALYCGHSAWGDYTKRDGNKARPGGTVTVREEFADQETGEKRHVLVEYRIDTEHAKLGEVVQAAANLKCGQECEIEVLTIQSPGRKTWQNIAAIRPAKPAQLAKTA